jgi:hypothetical protein
VERGKQEKSIYVLSFINVVFKTLALGIEKLEKRLPHKIKYV